MNEFKKNDVLVEIGNNKKYFWIVRDVVDDGYFFDAFFDGKFHVIGNWMSFRVAHKGLIKVDEWDDWKMVMQNVEDI